MRDARIFTAEDLALAALAFGHRTYLRTPHARGTAEGAAARWDKGHLIEIHGQHHATPLHVVILWTDYFGGILDHTFHAPLLPCQHALLGEALGDGIGATGTKSRERGALGGSGFTVHSADGRRGARIDAAPHTILDGGGAEVARAEHVHIVE